MDTTLICERDYVCTDCGGVLPSKGTKITDPPVRCLDCGTEHVLVFVTVKEP